MAFLANLDFLEGGNLKRQDNVLLGQHLLALGTEVVEAEVGGCVHTPVTVVGAGKFKVQFVNLAQTAEVHVAPVVDDVGSGRVTQVSQIVVLRACYLVVGVITRDSEFEPVALAKCFGVWVAAGQGVVGITAVGDVETGHHDILVGKDGYIARAVEGCGVGHAVVGRTVVAAANDIVPLVVECLILSLHAVGIAEEIPVVPVAHTARGKLIATAHELGTLVVLLGADANVAVGRNLKVLEIGHS